MRLLLILMFIPAFLGAQEIKDGMGKTYYDNNKKQVKEVYHYILNYKFTKDLHNPDIIKDTTILIKNGPYICYFKNGKMQYSGEYKNDQKSGQWLIYNEQGDLLRKENYLNGIIQQ